MPLFISLGSGGASPFLFNAAWKLGFISGIASFLVVRYWGEILSRATFSVIFSGMISWAMIFATISYFDLPLYAWSTQFIDISLVVIIYHIWPILFILVTARLFRTEARYIRITSGLLILLALGFAGFAFAITSQTGELGNFNAISFLGLSFGIILIITTAGVTSLTAFALRWGTDFQKMLNTLKSREINKSLELFGVLVALLIAASISVPITLFIGLINRETITIESAIIGIIGGIFAGTLPSISLRKANLITNNLGVNALSYVTPIVALIWLFLASRVDVARIDFLLIGAAAIIVANLLINFEAEVRFGFKILIIALWICGVIVYLRPVAGTMLGIENWLWGGTEYFPALALSATVFTLLLSFRIARLVARTTDENTQAFILFQRIDLLASRGVLANDTPQYILKIDVSEQKPEELRHAYSEASKRISDADSNSDNDADRERLNQAQAELNALVHSKQQGIVLGELFALYVFAGITVAVALFSRPDVIGLPAFLIEMFAVLFSTVIIFLISNVHDLQRERISAILKFRKKNGGYGVVFRNAQSRIFEQWLSVIVGLALAATFAGLLWYKWLGAA